MVTTPIGLIDGVYECYKLAGGLVFIMISMLVVMFCALATVVAVIRREEAHAREAVVSGRTEEIQCKS